MSEKKQAKINHNTLVTLTVGEVIYIKSFIDYQKKKVERELARFLKDFGEGNPNVRMLEQEVAYMDAILVKLLAICEDGEIKGAVDAFMKTVMKDGKPLST